MIFTFTYSQQLSEVNVIETTKNIHSHMFKHNCAFIAEYNDIYSQDCLSQNYLRGLFLPRDIVKFFSFSQNRVKFLIFSYQVNLIPIKLFIFILLLLIKIIQMHNWHLATFIIMEIIAKNIAKCYRSTS